MMRIKMRMWIKIKMMVIEDEDDGKDDGESEDDSED